MDINVSVPIKGFIVSYKKKGSDETYYLKINAYQDQAAVLIAKEYIKNNMEEGYEVLQIEATYKSPFTGVIN